MSKARLPVVVAFLKGDHSLIKKMTEEMDPKDPLYSYVRVVYLFHASKNESGDKNLLSEAAEQEINNALSRPPADLELFIIILHLASIFLSHSKRLSECQRVLRFFEQLKDHHLERDMRVLICRSEAKIYYALDDYPKLLESYNEGITQFEVKGSEAWVKMSFNLIWHALDQEDLGLCRRILSDLVPYRNKFQSYGTEPHGLLQSAYLYTCGKVHEGISLFDSISKNSSSEDGLYFKMRVQFLIKCGRLDEAKSTLAEARHKIQATTTKNIAFLNYLNTCHFENLCALEALAGQDLDRARQHAQQALSIGDRYKNISQESHGILLLTELAAGRRTAAQLILNHLDPDESRAKHSMEWARLYLLKGTPEKAVPHFKRILDQQIPEFIEDKLRYAFELSASQIGKLIGLASTSPSSISTPLPSINSKKSGSIELMGVSRALEEIRAQIHRFAKLSNSVLITAETGCGKEVVARLLHQMGNHPNEPFIAVNCGAISNTLIESELFGHVKGSFTGAVSDYEGLFLAAKHGTIFLDEITSMSTQLQVTLLRVLEDHQVRHVGGTKNIQFHARVIAASNEPLEQVVQRKEFRNDLYFRLAQLRVDIPPLRERREDILPIAKFFLEKIYGNFKAVLSNDLIAALQQYDWPGNVRELKNEIERISIMAGEVQELPPHLFHHSKRSGEFTHPEKTPQIKASPENDSFRNTFERRKELRKLFEIHQSLTRQGIIKLLKCGKNTATRDLKALEDEGWIRRVHTSTHLRTSYFTRSK